MLAATAQCVDDQATDRCKVLLDETSIFGVCYCAVDPQPYFDNCAYDGCVVKNDNDMVCSNFAAYVAACEHAGIEIENWREETNCPQRKLIQRKPVNVITLRPRITLTE